MKLSQNPSRELTALEYYQHLSTEEVMGIIGAKSKSTVWSYVRKGKLPPPHYPSDHRPVWRLGEVVDVFGEHLEPHDAKPRSFRGGERSAEQTDAPEPVKQKGTSAADRIRERFKLKR